MTLLLLWHSDTPPEHTHTHTITRLNPPLNHNQRTHSAHVYQVSVQEQHNLHKFPKAKLDRNSKKSIQRDERLICRGLTRGGGGVRTGARRLPVPWRHWIPTLRAERHGRWLIGNKKGWKKAKDGSYLSALAVQLEYRKSERVTEKLMRRGLKLGGAGTSLKLILQSSDFIMTLATGWGVLTVCRGASQGPTSNTGSSSMR